ncbi:MAG: hypothetical protein K6G24_13560 [Lachnospiraceae bacterium]|nr:hypothetical protein [Lachnospiraceae bacterium]
MEVSIARVELSFTNALKSRFTLWYYVPEIMLYCMQIVIIKKKAYLSPTFLKIYAVVMVLAVVYFLFEILESL